MCCFKQLTICTTSGANKLAASAPVVFLAVW
jgi:hypothetical protein